MGLADRDYSRRTPPPYLTPSLSNWRWWSVTTWLIVINVGVFILDRILFSAGFRESFSVPGGGARAIVQQLGPLDYWCHFSWTLAVHDLQLWRFLGFQFLHANLMHLAFNMLGLYFFGQFIESYLGRRRYLLFYLITGISGAVAYVILWRLGILVNSPSTRLVGASAGVFGVLMAAARLAPDMMVAVYGVIPVKLRYLAFVLIGVAAYTVLLGADNAGGEAAHLGGAIVGYWLCTRIDLLDRIAYARRYIGPRFRGRSNMRIHRD